MTSHWIVAGQMRPDPLSPIRYRRHRLAEYLTALDDTERVYWVYFRRRLRHSAEVEQVSAGVWAVQVRDATAFGRYATRTRVPSSLQEHLPVGGEPCVLWYTNPTFAGLARARRWSAVVYDCSDLWTEPFRGSFLGAPLWELQRRATARAEHGVVRSATHLLAASPYLVDYLRTRYGRESELVENGADLAAFESLDAVRPRGARPVLLYAGRLKERLDYELLERLAVALPDADVVLAGPVNGACQKKLDRVLRQTNVHYVGVVASTDVPALMAGATVGLMPYAETEWTRAASSPLKLFEYLAAGLPVVGSGAQDSVRHVQPDVYFFADSHEAFIDECSRLVGREDGPMLRDMRRRVASQHDWHAKFRASAVMLATNGHGGR
jgi:teichuronic acid biosynthesis glycosyltransferase TuaH